jgi:hypothetical protein
MVAGGLTGSVAEIMLSQENVTRQMAGAGCDGVRDALNAYLNVLDKYKDVEGSIVSGKTYFGDKMFTHARLAMIEWHEGNTEAAKNHMEIAMSACNNFGWDRCSEENILMVIERLDDNNPMACLKSERK